MKTAATIIFVHDEPAFSRNAIAAIRRVGHSVVHFADPLNAYDAILARDGASQARLLITRVRFAGGAIHGIALARMSLYRNPDLRILFVALPEFAGEAAQFGEFLPMSVSLEELAAAATRLTHAS